MDVLDDFSIQMPASIIADMVGLPHEHRAEFLEHAKRFNVAEETDDDPRPTEDAMAASLHVYELVTQIVAEAAKNPGDDVMGSLLKAHIPDFNGGTYQLREDQVATRVVELAGAGFETTAKQIGNAVVALAWYPEQRAELAADPSLMKNAVEEIVRWDPASHYVVRFIEEDVMLLHGGACCTGRPSPPTAAWYSSRRQPITMSESLKTPNCSTSTARSSGTSDSRSVLTFASVPPWPDWRQRWHSKNCWPATPITSCPAPSNAATPAMCAGSTAFRSSSNQPLDNRHGTLHGGDCQRHWGRVPTP